MHFLRRKTQHTTQCWKMWQLIIFPFTSGTVSINSERGCQELSCNWRESKSVWKISDYFFVEEIHCLLCVCWRKLLFTKHSNIRSISRYVLKYVFFLYFLQSILSHNSYHFYQSPKKCKYWVPLIKIMFCLWILLRYHFLHRGMFSSVPIHEWLNYTAISVSVQHIATRIKYSHDLPPSLDPVVESRLPGPTHDASWLG